jgi:hypothetical protein
MGSALIFWSQMRNYLPRAFAIWSFSSDPKYPAHTPSEGPRMDIEGMNATPMPAGCRFDTRVAPAPRNSIPSISV